MMARSFSMPHLKTRLMMRKRAQRKMTFVPNSLTLCSHPNHCSLRTRRQTKKRKPQLLHASYLSSGLSRTCVHHDYLSLACHESCLSYKDLSLVYERIDSLNVSRNTLPAHVKSDPSRPSSNPLMMYHFEILRERIRNNDLFTRGRDGYLLCFKSAFATEIKYLKTAYVANPCRPQPSSEHSPSEILLNERSDEIDRTFTGLLALYWIYHGDYHSFTRNQLPSAKLSEESFAKLCDFFSGELDHFQNLEKVLTLIIMQITNDLGKSRELQAEFVRIDPGHGNTEMNHDFFMYQVLKYHSELIPSIHSSDQKSMICELAYLASQHNPGQLVQGESPPALLDVLHDLNISAEALRLKYMESLLDVSGAQGHMNHDGAMTMTEPVFQVYEHACRVSQYVLLGGDTMQAWIEILDMRLQILKKKNWQGADALSGWHMISECAQLRLLCMARASFPEVADAVVEAFESLPKDTKRKLSVGLNLYGTLQDPAVLPAYMPEAFAVVLRQTVSNGPKRTEALAAVMSYLAEVLELSADEQEQAELGVVVVENDVRSVLVPLVNSAEFLEHPHQVIRENFKLPQFQIVRKIPVEEPTSTSHVRRVRRRSQKELYDTGITEVE